jgi:hypothetical protein
MSILKRKNKLPIFKDKTPIFFKQKNHKDDVVFEIKSGSYKAWMPTISEKLDLGRIIDNWSERTYLTRFIITNFGVISNNIGIIAIAVKDSSDKMEIYCRKSYFEDNVSHKKYINKFATANGLSVRKDIHYIDKDDINSWIKPIEIGLEFYDENVQAETSKSFFDKMKTGYPLYYSLN